jgi:predicted phage terminase large subunit-like protein
MDYPDPLGRKPGQPLDPYRHTVADLKMRAAKPRSWSALWQQNPRIQGGNIIKSEWFNIITPVELPRPRELYVVRAWDMAYSAKELAKRDPDFTAGVKLAHWRYDNTNRFIIMKIVRWQESWPVSKRRIRTYAQNDGTSVKIGLESGGPQKGLVDDLRSDPSLKGYRVMGAVPVHDKVARAQPWIDEAENGNFFLLDGDWVSEFLDECEGFPNSATHDDQMDALSIAFEMIKPRLRGRPVSTMRLTGLYK